MQQVMRIGDTLVPADDDIKDVAQASTEIGDIAHKYRAEMLAVIGKGEKHLLVAQNHEQDTRLEEDLVKIILLVYTMADTYKVDANDIVDAIKYVVEKGE